MSYKNILPLKFCIIPNQSNVVVLTHAWKNALVIDKTRGTRDFLLHSQIYK